MIVAAKEEQEKADALAAERAAFEKEKAEFEAKKAKEEEAARKKAEKEAERAARAAEKKAEAEERAKQRKQEQRERQMASLATSFTRTAGNQIVRGILGHLVQEVAIVVGVALVTEPRWCHAAPLSALLRRRCPEPKTARRQYAGAPCSSVDVLQSP